MCDKRTPSKTTGSATERVEHQQEEPKTQPDSKAESTTATTTTTTEGAKEEDWPPNQLRSHFKGMPFQWEKNKDKFPPKDAKDK
ncbi:hypothetical protein F4810DRAFT_310368 [Camillea tinctor]|nr:hypothetical protein F4810DRAFT_310368 [Camillea tinctor]